HLFENLTRRSQRFGEYRGLIGNAVRYPMQIHHRQSKEFSEGAIMADDTQHATTGAVRGNSLAAPGAKPCVPESNACEIDFANDAAPDPALVSGACDAHDFTHKFVAKGAMEIMVATQNLNIGIADSSKPHADQRPPGPQSRHRFLN